MSITNCPCCGSLDVITCTVADERAYGGGRNVVACCKECGRCDHRGHKDGQTCTDCGGLVAHKSAWAVPDHLPRPRGMSGDEFLMRATLFFLWRDHPATEFLGRLVEFADWFAERDMPEEAPYRAAWEIYGVRRRRNDPRAWCQWSVPIAPGWVRLETITTSALNGPTRDVKTIEWSKAKNLIGTRHNAKWFLCWPPGFVRFTGPLYYDHNTLCRVTLARERFFSTATRSVERYHPAGYATLFYPPGELPAQQADAVRRKTVATPSLLDVLEETP